MKKFEIKTWKGTIFSKIFELVQSYIKEIEIRITPDGFHICSYDLSRKSVTKIDLKQEKFEYFDCKKEFTFGIYSQSVYKTIKSITKKDMITFYVDENESFLTILLSNPSAQTKEYKIPLLMIENKFLEIPNEKFEDYDHVISIPTLNFKSLIKEFNLLDITIIEIKSTEKELKISNVDGELKTNFTYRELSVEQKKKVEDYLQGEDIKCIKYLKYKYDGIIQGKFNLRKLKSLVKATNLCDYLNLYLKNNSPLVLEFFTADMGTFKYLLMDHTENDQ